MITVSTHVLDGDVGGGLAGVAVSVTDAAGIVVGSGETGDDGRIAQLASDVPSGTYRIDWHTGGTFIRTVTAEVDLSIDRHYHVALVASGASAVIYLGA